MLQTSDLKLPSIGDILNKVNPLSNTVFGKYDLIDHTSQRTICSFEAFLGWSRKRDSSLPSSSVEQGSFVQYNKIIMPDTFTVILAKTGLPYELQKFDAELSKYFSSTNNVDIVLPVGSFVNYNMKDMNYGISEGDAVNMIVVQMTFVEIREATPSFSSKKLLADKLKNPLEASTKDLGQKQKSLLARAFNNGKSIVSGWFGG